MPAELLFALWEIETADSGFEKRVFVRLAFPKMSLLQLSGSLHPAAATCAAAVRIYVMLQQIGLLLNEKWSVLVIIQDIGLNLNL